MNVKEIIRGAGVGAPTFVGIFAMIGSEPMGLGLAALLALEVAYFCASPKLWVEVHRKVLCWCKKRKRVAMAVLRVVVLIAIIVVHFNGMDPLALRWLIGVMDEGTLFSPEQNVFFTKVVLSVLSVFAAYVTLDFMLEDFFETLESLVIEVVGTTVLAALVGSVVIQMSALLLATLSIAAGLLASVLLAAFVYSIVRALFSLASRHVLMPVTLGTLAGGGSAIVTVGFEPDMVAMSTLCFALFAGCLVGYFIHKVSPCFLERMPSVEDMLLR